ncbi:MAG TPA: LysM peptidoglycan-binding domain-containing protein [Mycobacteriales bacterium]|nr:LysM peptidoglycan-binding domain-containing protein [Mycobacteriales bacterium]
MTSVAAARISGAGVPRRSSGAPPAKPAGKQVAGFSLPRISIPWNEPMPWTFLLVAVLLVILGAHNRIARDIGTAAPPSQGAVTALSTADNPPVGLSPQASSDGDQSAAPLPTHAPRDPFQALVSAAGARVPAVALPIAKAGSLATTHVKHHGAPPVTVAPGGGSSSLPTATLPITSNSGSGTTHSGTTHSGATHSGSSASGSSPSGSSPRSAGSSTSGRCLDVHVVRAGESLWSIAQQHVNQTGHGNTNSYWHRIYHANSQLIGANPSQIAIGLHLCLPSP